MLEMLMPTDYVYLTNCYDSLQVCNHGQDTLSLLHNSAARTAHYNVLENQTSGNLLRLIGCYRPLALDSKVYSTESERRPQNQGLVTHTCVLPV